MKRSAAGTFPTFKQATKRIRKPQAAPSVRRQLRVAKPESKVFDTTLSFLFDTTGEVPATGQLALIQVGDTLNNRDGATIQVTSIQIRGIITQTPAAAAASATCAFIQVMLDRQPNGAAATFSGDVNSVMTTNSWATAFPLVPNQHRFKCLKRIVVPLNSQAGVTTAYNNCVAYIDEYIKLNKPIEVRYNASTGAVADITTNNIFLIAGSDGNSDDTINMAGACRIRFVG